MTLEFFQFDESKLIVWLFALAIALGVSGAMAVFVLIRRDRKKN